MSAGEAGDDLAWGGAEGSGQCGGSLSVQDVDPGGDEDVDRRDDDTITLSTRRTWLRLCCLAAARTLPATVTPRTVA